MEKMKHSKYREKGEEGRCKREKNCKIEEMRYTKGCDS